jgi:hypothetical protein
MSMLLGGALDFQQLSYRQGHGVCIGKMDIPLINSHEILGFILRRMEGKSIYLLYQRRRLWVA